MNNSNTDNNESIHDRFNQIYEETNVDRKSEISNRIKFGDSFTKLALGIGFWGFWVFWAIVALMAL